MILKARLTKITLSISLLLSSCGYNSSAEYVMPIPDECNDDVSMYVRQINDQFKNIEGINARLKLESFEYGDFKHPFIGMYLELSGSISKDRQRLLFNSVAHMCYPNNKITLPNITDRDGLLLAENLDLINSMGIKHIYIQYTNNNKIELLFHDEPIEK